MESRFITDGTLVPFKDLIAGDTVYVDKTKFACELAKGRGSYLLTRPRRMGKSTMVSTLEYLFSKGTVGTEGLYCYDHWKETKRYFVFNLSFSKLDSDSVDAFKYNLFRKLIIYANYFGVEIHKEDPIHLCFEQLVLQCVNKLSDKSFLADHPELQDGERPLCTDKVVLLIDEYDTPLSENLDNKVVFDEIKKVYRTFFATIKDINFRFVFVTGVSSYAQTSIFSGANQFKNISLNDEYATCCGYTQDEIEHYFAPELKNAQEVLDLDYDELMAKLSYFYDGYLFTQLGNRDNRSKNVFSPVSVSSFLTSPINGFINYWSGTGAQNSFIFKLFGICSQVVKSKVLKRLYPDFFESIEQNSPELLKVIESMNLVFMLDLNDRQLNDYDAHLIKVDIDSLIFKIDNLDDINDESAIAVLFQSGYLSIKRVEGEFAYLGLANYEVAKTLTKFVMSPSFYKEPAQYKLYEELQTFFDNRDSLFASFHEGGHSLAKQINLILNLAPEDLFAPNNRENVVTGFCYIAIKFSGIGVAREVHYVLGRADLVVYKPDLNILVEDTVFEFKLARHGENILTKLAEGTKQVIDKRYGLSVENPNPYRYCVVFSNDLRQVGAIEAINADGTSKTVYVSDKLNEDGTVNSKLLPSKE
ncbi:MAG: AAA family ATPase [Anaerobiospirillum succiniciproducens]|uniref:AAA family ATPase n=2 Tax=Anaerobiospirillum succiniciproducens TaxID=13335 RepID=UPI0026DB8025|nr:AAA family ATPase [Anaerobiospirillum succiniciproducens]MDO4676914.1 AAA family ATPase [Anaerobiospirillum succiniciproducens]